MAEIKNVTVAMSGGIDSAVSALVALENGYKVTGATMRLCPKITNDGDMTEQDICDAAAVCKTLGIPHRVYNMQDLFETTVIRDFVDTYYRGGTPNPCIVCNKTMKFGAFLDKEIESGADYIATGHYARIEEKDGRFLLKKAADERKDQTYMLWSLSQHQLAHTIFPLGDMTKPEIRELGEKRGFVIAHKSDSQDICFVPDGDYAAFLEKTVGERYPEGNYIDESGKILGKHKGIIHYTIGQRKGLGLSLGKPGFVTAIDPKANTVTVVSDETHIFSTRLVCNTLNFQKLKPMDCGTVRAEGKVRYAAKPVMATVQIKGDIAEVLFDSPVRAVTPGQSVVFYDGDDVLFGGIICS